MSQRAVTVRGQPAVVWEQAGVGRLAASLHGGQLLSWQDASGAERLYLSPDAVFDAAAPIRGGIPVCWPQFNRRGPDTTLPKHGFARNLPWEVVEHPGAALALALRSSTATRAMWPHDFLLRIAFTPTAAGLQVDLQVHNTGEAAFDFTAALHSYLAVADVRAVSLAGLEGMPVWDAVADRRAASAAAPAFGTAFDRVYARPAEPLRLQHAAGGLAIASSPSCPQVVVWNPGPGEALADVPAGGWQHFLCVEAAAIDQPVRLAPGGVWQAWQTFAVL